MAGLGSVSLEPRASPGIWLQFDVAVVVSCQQVHLHSRQVWGVSHQMGEKGAATERDFPVRKDSFRPGQFKCQKSRAQLSKARTPIDAFVIS